MPPTVTIVTPAYNACKTIRQTLESVLGQDYHPLEHIVVDGGSRDGTVEILAEYPHLRWISETDRGQSHALNKGFAMAQGEIIGWLNADDCYRPGAIRKAVAYLDAHPEADLVYSDVRVVDGAGSLIRVAQGEPFDLEKLLYKNMVKQPTVFMRREVIAALGGVDESLHYVMDHEFWLRAGTRFNLVYLPGEAFADFRFEAGTKSHESAPEFLLEWLSVLSEITYNHNLNVFQSGVLSKAIRITQSRVYLRDAAATCQHPIKRIEGFRAIQKALVCNPRLLMNRNVWSIFRVLISGQPNST